MSSSASKRKVYEIFRNMIILATGTGLANIISIGAIPLISRIYTPEHFGVLSVFSALTAILSSMGTLRYTVALPLPNNSKLAVNLLVLCCGLLVAFFFIVWLVLWCFAPVLLRLLSMEILLPYLWLIIVSVFAVGAYDILSNWAMREKAFKPLAKTKVWQSSLGAVTKIGFGLIDLKPLGLLLGQVLALAGGTVSLFWRFYRKISENLKFVSKKRLFFLFRYYSDIPKYRLPSQILLVFSTQAPILFCALLFDPKTTGQLSMAFMVVEIPVSLFGKATGQAFYAEIARLGRKNIETLHNVTTSLTQKLFMISVLPFLALLFGGSWGFTFFLGEKWEEAGDFASILAVLILGKFVSGPLINILSLFGKQKMYLLLNVVRVGLMVFAFGLSKIIDLNSKSTILLFSILLAAHYFFVTFSIFSVINREKR